MEKTDKKRNTKTKILGIFDFHGGRIWVESDGKDKGAAFTFTVPKKGETE